VNIINSLWVECYRPKKIEEVILPDEYRINFDEYIAKREIPNLIFSGSPGSGKTCVAAILTSKNGVLSYRSDNLLEINGSSKDSRGISFVNDVIEPFIKIPPAGNDKHKIVFIDEADFLCLDGNTEIKILEDDKVINKRIEELKDLSEIQVISVNLSNNKLEIDFAEYVDSGIAEMFEIELEDGKKVICSENHPFFIMDKDGKLIEKKLKELTENHEIVTIEENF